MTNRLIAPLFVLLTWACGQRSEVQTQDATDTISEQTLHNAASTVQSHIDTIMLYEDRINGIRLPFERKEMLVELQEKFGGYTVAKAIGQQDGPDYPYYSVMDNDISLASFAMDASDTLKLERLYVEHPAIKDEYGITVGDAYAKIKDLRNGVAKISTDPHHQHTVLYFDGSNIMYEISGELSLP
jgi:hypothetical protein